MKTATETIKPIVPKMDPIIVATIESRNVTKKQENDNHAASKSNMVLCSITKFFTKNKQITLRAAACECCYISTFNLQSHSSLVPASSFSFTSKSKNSTSLTSACLA